MSKIWNNCPLRIITFPRIIAPFLCEKKKITHGYYLRKYSVFLQRAFLMNRSTNFSDPKTGLCWQQITIKDKNKIGYKITHPPRTVHQHFGGKLYSKSFKHSCQLVLVVSNYLWQLAGSDQWRACNFNLFSIIFMLCVHHVLRLIY